MDLVHAFYRAVNRGDTAAVVNFYHPHCIVEYVFTDDEHVYEGVENVSRRWADEFAKFAGALPGGHRFDVGRVAGMETGWGWVRADWTSVLTRLDDNLTEPRAGYSHFLIEDGRIRRHRSIVKKMKPDDAPADLKVRPTVAPSRPIVGVGAVVFVESGDVVLVKRQHEPLAGQWSLPGGRLELGESLQAGTAREIHEETGLVVDVGPVVDVFDRILLDEFGGVRHHFVLVDFLCRPRGGVLVAGSDVVDVRAVPPAEVASYRVAPKALAVIARAVEMWGTVAWNG